VVPGDIFASHPKEHRCALGADVRRSGGVRQEYLIFVFAKGGEEMRDIKKLTKEEILEILCAPEITDEPEESDFVETDETEEEKFVKNWIEKEMN
jgi:hypothetical protein